MKLIISGSSSKGNSYALQSDSGEILLIEAGIPLKEVKRAIGYKTSKVVGCITSHVHSDHAKYIPEYLKAGISVSSNDEVAEKYPGVDTMSENITFRFGNFGVTPFEVQHDAKNFGYLIHEPSYGTIFFATDCYNLHFCIQGCKTYLAECNYSDAILDKAVEEGKTPRSQADRVRLSHMSLEHAISWLHDCDVEHYARHIILIHGSARHLNPSLAVNKFQQVLGVPTIYAEKEIKINLT